MTTSNMNDVLSELKNAQTELSKQIQDADSIAKSKNLTNPSNTQPTESLSDLLNSLDRATNFEVPAFPKKTNLSVQPEAIPYGKAIPSTEYPGLVLYGSNAYPDLGRAYKIRPTDRDLPEVTKTLTFIPNRFGVEGVIGWYYGITTASSLYRWVIYTNESYPKIEWVNTSAFPTAWIKSIADCRIIPIDVNTTRNDVPIIGIYQTVAGATEQAVAHRLDPVTNTIDVHKMYYIPYLDFINSTDPIHVVWPGEDKVYAWNSTSGMVYQTITKRGLQPNAALSGQVLNVYNAEEGQICVLKGAQGKIQSLLYTSNDLSDEYPETNTYSYNLSMAPNSLSVTDISPDFHLSGNGIPTSRFVSFNGFDSADSGAQLAINKEDGSATFFSKAYTTNSTIKNPVDVQRFGDYVFGFNVKDGESFFFSTGSNYKSRPLTAFGSALLVTELDGGVDAYPSAQIVVTDDGLSYRFGDALSHQMDVGVFAGIEEIVFQKRVSPESPEVCKICVRNLAYPNAWPFLVNGRSASWYKLMTDPSNPDTIVSWAADREAFIDFYPNQPIRVRIPSNGDPNASLNVSGISGIYDVLVIFRTDFPQYERKEQMEANLGVPMYSNDYEAGGMLAYKDRSNTNMTMYDTSNGYDKTYQTGLGVTHLRIASQLKYPHNLNGVGGYVIRATDIDMDGCPVSPSIGVHSSTLRTVCMCDVTAQRSATDIPANQIIMFGGQATENMDSSPLITYPIVYFRRADASNSEANAVIIGPGAHIGTPLAAIFKSFPDAIVTSVCSGYLVGGADYSNFVLGTLIQTTNKKSLDKLVTSNTIENGPRILLTNLNLGDKSPNDYYHNLETANRDNPTWYSTGYAKSNWSVTYSLQLSDLLADTDQYHSNLKEIVVTDMKFVAGVINKNGGKGTQLILCGTGVDVTTNATIPFFTYANVSISTNLTLSAFHPLHSCLSNQQPNLLSDTYAGTLPGDLSVLPNRIAYGLHGTSITQPTIQSGTPTIEGGTQTNTFSAHLQVDPSIEYSTDLAKHGNSTIFPSLLHGNQSGYKICGVAFGNDVWVAVGMQGDRPIILTSLDGASWTRTDGFPWTNLDDTGVTFHDVEIVDVKFITLANGTGKFFAILNMAMISGGIDVSGGRVLSSHDGRLWSADSMINGVTSSIKLRCIAQTRQSFIIGCNGSTWGNPKKEVSIFVADEHGNLVVNPYSIVFSSVGIPDGSVASVDCIAGDRDRKNLIAIVNFTDPTTNEKSFTIIKSTDDGKTWTKVGLSSTEGSLSLGHVHVSNLVASGSYTYATCNKTPLPTLLIANGDSTVAENWKAMPLDIRGEYSSNASSIPTMSKLIANGDTCMIFGNVPETDGIIRPTIMQVSNGGTQFTSIHRYETMRNLFKQTLYDAVGFDGTDKMIAFFSEGAQTDSSLSWSRWMTSSTNGATWKYYSQIQILDSAVLEYADGTSEIMCVGRCLNFGILSAYWMCSKDEGNTWIDMLDTFQLHSNDATNNYTNTAYHCYYPCISPLLDSTSGKATGAIIGVVDIRPGNPTLQSDCFTYTREDGAVPAKMEFATPPVPIKRKITGCESSKNGDIYFYGTKFSTKGYYPWYGKVSNGVITEIPDLPTGTDIDAWVNPVLSNSIRIFTSRILWSGREYLAIGTRRLDSQAFVIMSSLDGICWKPHTTIPSDVSLLSMASHNGIALVGGFRGNKVFMGIVTSSGVLEVTPKVFADFTVSSSDYCGAADIVWEDGSFYALIDATRKNASIQTCFFITSNDGINWSEPFEPSSYPVPNQDALGVNIVYNTNRQLYIVSIWQNSPMSFSLLYGSTLTLGSISSTFSAALFSDLPYAYFLPQGLSYDSAENAKNGILIATILVGRDKSDPLLDTMRGAIVTQVDGDPNGVWNVTYVPDAMHTITLSKPFYWKIKKTWVVNTIDRILGLLQSTSKDGIHWTTRTISFDELNFVPDVPDTGVVKLSSITEHDENLIYCVTTQKDSGVPCRPIIIKQSSIDDMGTGEVITSNLTPSHNPVGLYTHTDSSTWMPINYTKALDSAATFELLRYSPVETTKWTKFTPSLGLPNAETFTPSALTYREDIDRLCLTGTYSAHPNHIGILESSLDATAPTYMLSGMHVYHAGRGPLPFDASDATLSSKTICRPSSILWKDGRYHVGLNVLSTDRLLDRPIMSLPMRITDLVDWTCATKTMNFGFYQPTHTSIDQLHVVGSRAYLLGSTETIVDSAGKVPYFTSAPRFVSTSLHTDIAEYETPININQDAVAGTNLRVSFKAVAHSDDSYVAVYAQESGVASNFVCGMLVSHDGVNWKNGANFTISYDTHFTVNSVVYSKKQKQFIVPMGMSKNLRIYRSADGESWTYHDFPYTDLGYPATTAYLLDLRVYRLNGTSVATERLAIVGYYYDPSLSPQQVGSLLVDSGSTSDTICGFKRVLSAETVQPGWTYSRYYSIAYGNNSYVILGNSSAASNPNQFCFVYSTSLESGWIHRQTDTNSDTSGKGYPLIFADGRFLSVHLNRGQTELVCRELIEGRQGTFQLRTAHPLTDFIPPPIINAYVLNLTYESGLYVISLYYDRQSSTAASGDLFGILVLTSNDGIRWSVYDKLFQLDTLSQTQRRHKPEPSFFVGEMINGKYFIGGCRTLSSADNINSTTIKFLNMSPFLSLIDFGSTTSSTAVPILIDIKSSDAMKNVNGSFSSDAYTNYYAKRIDAKKTYTSPYLLDFDEAAKGIPMYASYLYQRSHRSTIAYPLLGVNTINVIQITSSNRMKSSLFPSCDEDSTKWSIKAESMNLNQDTEEVLSISNVAHLSPNYNSSIVLNSAMPYSEKNAVRQNQFLQAIQVTTKQDILTKTAKKVTKSVPLTGEDSFYTQTIAPISQTRLNAPYFKIDLKDPHQPDTL